MPYEKNAANVLPKTEPLVGSKDYAREMVAGISRLLDNELTEADAARRNDSLFTTADERSYVQSVEDRRHQLARVLGVVDARLPIGALDLSGTTVASSKIAESHEYEVHAVRWPVLPGVEGEGLLLRPTGVPVAHIIAVPDADQTPEDLVGLTDALPHKSQFARHFAEAGCQVVVPTLLSRECTWSGNPAVRMTNQPHREFVYRMAFEMGRHVIGYEVQKILSLVDYFAEHSSQRERIGLFGYGEGGLLSLCCGALDSRISAIGVSGYFRDRHAVWQEPIYRNVWRLLRGLSDAELAAMVAPRDLIIENSRPPAISGPPNPTDTRRGAAPGSLTPPAGEEVLTEVELARTAFARLHAAERLVLVEPNESTDAPFGTADACQALLRSLSFNGSHPSSISALRLSGSTVDSNERQRRQFEQLCSYTHRLWEASAGRRNEFWSDIDRSSPTACESSIERYRTYFGDDVIGAYPTPTGPLRPRSRLLESRAEYALYEVVLDLWDGVPSFGYLLLPEGIPESTPRPVVVCQHGLGGDPAPIIDEDSKAYKAFGRRLAERGYIVYVPQAPFVGPMGDDFRVLQRKANPLGLSLFSFIVAQHRRFLDWLSALPYVDKDRIALYGLSYGGKTAMRVPALVTEYALSICSGDFNEWIMKNVSRDFFSSYMFTGEYEIFEFDLGHTFNYAEMAYLISPRPFMVERGHDDGCSSDEWVAFEFAKVRRHYTRLGLRERAEIEFFDGGHEINGEGTFRFLDRHLNWTPKRKDD